MHSRTVHEQVQQLVGQGLKDGAIARELGFARTTVRDMRKAAALDPGRELCWRCWQPTREVRFTPGEYAELLGFYLGDGHIVRAGRAYRLRIALDSRHARVVADVRGLLERVLPQNRISIARLDGGRTSVVSIYSQHLPCLFPQHGPGKKHHRRIVLEPWQQELVDQAPWSFLRGCVHSDGCFFINRTGRHRYLSVTFDNLSGDVRELFMAACERVGVRCRPNGRSVRVYRREDVAALAAFVGAKW